MENQTAPLRHLLREQLTAVHQQFVHVLTLREWGDEEFVKSIQQVDNADFPVAMKIMDHLVAAGVPLDLAYQPFAPGGSVGAIIAAERAIERRMGTALAIEVGHPAAEWLATARAPRPGYAAWLDARERALNGDGRGEIGDPAVPGDLFGHLIALIEQAMAHAFVHWHRGDRADADAAWATSGAAMMQATALTRAAARRRAVPVPDKAVAVTVRDDPAEARDADRRLAAACAEAARKAGPDTDGEIASLCRAAAAFAEGAATPRSAAAAVEAGPKAFNRFEGVLAKYVH